MNIQDIINKIKPIDSAVKEAAVARTASLAMPLRAMGRINELSESLCAITGSLTPRVDKRALFIMAGDHGVCAQGVSLHPQEVTRLLMQVMLLGKSSVTVYAEHAGAEVVLADMGTLWDIDLPIDAKCRFYSKKAGLGTADFTQGAAMTREQAEFSVVESFKLASELIESEKYNLIATGEMGIGNTTPSAAIAAVYTGLSPEKVTGRGAGMDDAGLIAKTEAVRKGIELNKPDKDDALDVLAKVGGFEIGGIAGVILAAAAHRVPVLLDGFIAGAGALIAQGIAPLARDYMLAGHLSDEAGHRHVLDYLKLEPLLSLGMRLGEGTGAVCAMPLVEMAAATIEEIATLKEAGVI